LESASALELPTHSDSEGSFAEPVNARKTAFTTSMSLAHGERKKAEPSLCE